MLTFNRLKMLAAFKAASAFAPQRSPKAILNNVKLVTRGQSVSLMATDLDVGIVVRVEGAEIQTPADYVLPTSRFGAILSECTEEQLTIERDGEVTAVAAGRSSFRLPSADPDSFPDVASFAEPQYHLMPVECFRTLIERTEFACDVESSRYALGGSLLELTATKAIAVATDGRRLATVELPAQSIERHSTEDRSVEDRSVIVPRRAMALFSRALASAEGDVRLAARESDVLVGAEGMTLYARLAEGRYPKWRDVFPRRTNAVRIQLPVFATLSAVRQAAIVTDNETRGIKFTFGFGNLKLTGSTANRGTSAVELPIDYPAQPIAILMDPRYLIDFLSVLPGSDTFTVEIQDAKSAVVCSTEDGYRYVIMPLSLDR